MQLFHLPRILSSWFIALDTADKLFLIWHFSFLVEKWKQISLRASDPKKTQQIQEKKKKKQAFISLAVKEMSQTTVSWVNKYLYMIKWHSSMNKAHFISIVFFEKYMVTLISNKEKWHTASNLYWNAKCSLISF